MATITDNIAEDTEKFYLKISISDGKVVAGHEDVAMVTMTVRGWHVVFISYHWAVAEHHHTCGRRTIAAKSHVCHYVCLSVCVILALPSVATVIFDCANYNATWTKVTCSYLSAEG